MYNQGIIFPNLLPQCITAIFLHFSNFPEYNIIIARNYLALILCPNSNFQWYYSLVISGHEDIAVNEAADTLARKGGQTVLNQTVLPDGRTVLTQTVLRGDDHTILFSVSTR